MQDENQAVRRSTRRRRPWFVILFVVIVGVTYGVVVGIGAKRHWWDEMWVTVVFLAPVAMLLLPDIVKSMKRMRRRK